MNMQVQFKDEDLSNEYVLRMLGYLAESYRAHVTIEEKESSLNKSYRNVINTIIFVMFGLGKNGDIRSFSLDSHGYSLLSHSPPD